jgi:hypothetical protein
MARADGVVLRPRAERVAAGSRASSVFGVWDGLGALRARRFGIFQPTAKGMAEMKAFTHDVNPVADCVPFPAPFLANLPYLNQIEARGDTIVIRSELFNVDRTVHMDGRDHPRDGVRTNQGPSIGRWEDGVLVVDTTLFADHRLGNSQGRRSRRESLTRRVCRPDLASMSWRDTVSARMALGSSSTSCSRILTIWLNRSPQHRVGLRAGTSTSTIRVRPSASAAFPLSVMR